MLRSLFTVVALLGIAAGVRAQDLTVRLYDSRGGEPLAGVVLEASSPSRDGVLATSVSDVDGRASFRGLPPGPLALESRGTLYALSFELAAAERGEIAVYADELGAPLTLPAYTVRAVRARPEDPFAVDDIDAEPLARANPGQDIPTLLRRTPGAVYTSDAGTGVGYSGIRIRGADATRVNVTINGVPLNDAESQGVFWVNMPDFISSTSSIQVQRGVGTSTYGTGAFGANVNLQTDAPPQTPQLIGELGGGSFATGRAMVKASTGRLGGGFSAEGRLSYITSAGYVDRASSRLGSAYVTAAYDRGGADRLQLIAWTGHERTYQSWFGVPTSYLDDATLRTYNPAGVIDDSTFYDDQVDDYRQSHAQLLYSRTLPADWLLQLTGHYTRGRGFYEEYRGGAALFDYGLSSSPDSAGDLVRRLWLDNHFFGGIATVTGELSESLSLTYSLGANQYRGRHFGTVPEVMIVGGEELLDGLAPWYDNDAVKTDLNTFAKLQARLTPRFTVYGDLQLRHVRYGFDGVDRDAATLPQEVDFTFFNPKLGGRLAEVGGGSLWASAAVGQREPNRSDFTEAPPEQQPRPERLYDFEFGYDLAVPGGLTLATNAYWMEYRNQLALTGQLNDVGEQTRRNIRRSSRFGVEVAAAYPLSGAWTLEGNLAASETSVKTYTEYITDWTTGEQRQVTRSGFRLAFSPNLVTNAGLRYAPELRVGALDLALWANTVSAQYLDNSASSIARLPGYTRVDFEASFAPAEVGAGRVLLTLQVQNLLDARVATNGYAYRFDYPGADPRAFDPYALRESGNTYVGVGVYPQAGVTVLGGVRWELGLGQ